MNTTLSFSGLLLLALSACASGPPYPARMIGHDAERNSNVVVADAALWNTVCVDVASVERVPGSNQLKVMVPVRNLSDEQIEVLVQVSFLDGRRMPTADDTNPQLQVFAPGETKPITMMSKFDTAQDWTMRISWNR